MSPFLALRSYLPADHPDKAKEIGSEATPAAFVDTLLALSAEWRRVLAPHGSIAVELGDTYSSPGGTTDNRETSLGGNDDAPRSQRGGGPGWPLAKSLALVPEAYRFALAYGINPHTGAESPAGRWRVRNVVRWVRPNPPVGALGDKYRPATSEMVVACVSGRRWFDLDAVRGPYSENSHPRTAKGTDSRPNDVKTSPDGNRDTLAIRNNDGAGAPPLDWWNIPTAPYKGAHYATYPPQLCVIPVESMCPREVCRVCGEPRRRIAETTNAAGHAVHRRAHHMNPDGAGDGRVGVADVHTAPDYSERKTLGWSDCGHDNYRPGLVLDPFGGSGTTGAVSTGHGRNCVLIDLDERNAELARERIGPMLVEVSYDLGDPLPDWLTSTIETPTWRSTG